MYLLNLNSQTRVLLLYALTHRIVTIFVLLVLLPQHVVAILD
jgi:hypothetical protein